MDVQCRVTYPARQARGNGADPRPNEIDVDLEIADLRGRPIIPAFVVRHDAALPGIRIHHDVRRTALHDGRYWMAVSEPDSGGLRSGPASEDLVRETIARAYVDPVLPEFGPEVDKETIEGHLVAAARRGAENLAVLADGRLYEADVVPLYEIKDAMEACVCIVPSSVRRLERAAYFRPDRTAEAEAHFRSRNGQGAFPAIVACDEVAVPEEAALWSLAEAARDAVDRFDDGIDERLRERWLDRLCGLAVVESLRALRRTVATPEPRLQDLVEASLALVRTARDRLQLGRSDELTRALTALEDKAKSAERLMAERAPAMTDPPGPRRTPPSEHAA